MARGEGKPARSSALRSGSAVFGIPKAIPSLDQVLLPPGAISAELCFDEDQFAMARLWMEGGRLAETYLHRDDDAQYCAPFAHPQTYALTIPLRTRCPVQRWACPDACRLYDRPGRLRCNGSLAVSGNGDFYAITVEYRDLLANRNNGAMQNVYEAWEDQAVLCAHQVREDTRVTGKGRALFAIPTWVFGVTDYTISLPPEAEAVCAAAVFRADSYARLCFLRADGRLVETILWQQPDGLLGYLDDAGARIDSAIVTPCACTLAPNSNHPMSGPEPARSCPACAQTDCTPAGASNPEPVADHMGVPRIEGSARQ